MASIASFRLEEGHRSLPISLHPAFPAVVAIWFAALLGLGSLVLPGVLIERFVEATGLAAVIPAAAPPLGFTARALVAVTAGLVGAALGVAIARRVAAPHAPAANARASRAVAGSRRPISVHEELGGDGLTNGKAPPLNRRRATLIADFDALARDTSESPALPRDDVESAEPIGVSPLPQAAALAAEDEPLVLCDIAGDEPCRTLAGPVETPVDAADEARSMSDEALSAPAPAEDESLNHPSPHHDLWDDRESDPQEFDRSAEPSAADPLPFAGPTPLGEGASGGIAVGSPEPHDPGDPILKPVAAAPAPDSFRADWEEKPLDDLGLVQLVQRLGSAIEKRRAAIAAPFIEPAPTPPSPPATGVEAARAEEAARAMAAYFGGLPAAQDEPPLAPEARSAAEPAGGAPVADLPRDPSPAAPPGLRPAFLSGLATAAAEGDEEPEESYPDFTLPRHQPDRSDSLHASIDEGRAGPLADPAEEAGEGEEADADGFPSLLALRNPGASEKKVVQIDEDFPAPGAQLAGSGTGANRLFDPPAEREDADSLASPHSEPAPEPESGAQPEPELEPGVSTGLSPGPDADAALRAALATLQRMSGPSESRFG